MPFYLENMDLINGKASQHLQYLPYGESFVEQKTTATYYTPYRFSGKEKDEETQYSYFGARYYDADLSVWLSVDPMASSRSWISPYNYCQWNPVGRVDPSGMLDDEWDVCKMKDGTVKVTWMNDNGGKATHFVNFSYESDNGGHVKAGGATVDIDKKETASGPGGVNQVQEQKGTLGTSLSYTNDCFNAIGTAAAAGKLYTQANADARITYYTMLGTKSWISSSKVVSGLKSFGNIAFGASIIVDLTLTIAGEQSPGKTALNTAVGGVAIIVGGVPGLVIGIGYTVLDKTGMLDGPEYITPYTPPSIAMPDATRVALPVQKLP